MLPHHIDQLVEAVLAHEQMQEMQAYIARGRTFESVTVEALSEAWLAAVAAVAFGDDGSLGDWADLSAEFELRRLARPEHLVSPEVMVALQGRVVRSTPEHFEAVTKHVGRVRRHLAKESRH
jgi:hypothetical protein